MNGQNWALGLGIFAASLFGGLALRASDLGTLPWAVSRASGLVAFALLSGSVVFGLAISTKVTDGLLSRAFTFALHQFLSVLTLTFLGIHVGVLFFDGAFHFTPFEAVIPFVSSHAPLWTGLGVVAAWLAAGVTASFWGRSRIGQRAWRKLHYLSFATYILSLVHGATVGSDTGIPLVQWLYFGSAGMVAALLTYRVGLVRIASSAPASRIRRHPAPAAAERV